MAALNKENCEEDPSSNIAQNSSFPKLQEDYITQVSEAIGGKITTKLSAEFSWTENYILGALSRLDNFLLNPLFQGYSGTTSKTSRDTHSTNQETNEDDSQIDPHPEASIFCDQRTQNSGQKDGHDNSFHRSNNGLCIHSHKDFWFFFLLMLPIFLQCMKWEDAVTGSYQISCKKLNYLKNTSQHPWGSTGHSDTGNEVFFVFLLIQHDGFFQWSYNTGIVETKKSFPEHGLIIQISWRTKNLPPREIFEEKLQICNPHD